MTLTPENQKNYQLPIDSAISAKIPRGQSLFLTGQSGNGKTTLALQLAKELLDDTPELDVQFIRFIDLVQLARRTYNEGDEGWQARRKVEEHKGAFLLILDDVGAEKQTAFVDQLIYDLIDYRYQNSLPTFVTSNYSLTEIGSRYHERIASRLTAMCGNPIYLPKRDRRQGSQPQKFEVPKTNKEIIQEAKTERRSLTEEERERVQARNWQSVLKGIRKTNPTMADRAEAGKDPYWSKYVQKFAEYAQ